MIWTFMLTCVIELLTVASSVTVSEARVALGLGEVNGVKLVEVTVSVTVAESRL